MVIASLGRVRGDRLRMGVARGEVMGLGSKVWPGGRCSCWLRMFSFSSGTEMKAIPFRNVLKGFVFQKRSRLIDNVFDK